MPQRCWIFCRVPMQCESEVLFRNSWMRLRSCCSQVACELVLIVHRAIRSDGLPSSGRLWNSSVSLHTLCEELQ